MIGAFAAAAFFLLPRVGAEFLNSEYWIFEHLRDNGIAIVIGWLAGRFLYTLVDDSIYVSRLYLGFEAADGKDRSMEIIWGNRVLRAGDYTHLESFFGSFPHYVANGGDENLGRWHRETVDLAEIYRELWKDSSGARLVDIGLFGDSDETGGQTVAYFADVRVQRASAPAP